MNLFKTPEGEVLCWPCAKARRYEAEELRAWTVADWEATIDQNDEGGMVCGPACCAHCGEGDVTRME